jgi:hypothetical protein
VKSGDAVVHRTDMRVNNVRYDQNLPATLFSPEYLDQLPPDGLRPQGADPHGSTKAPSVLGALRVKAMMAPTGLLAVPKGVLGVIVTLIVLSTALALIAIVRRRRAGLQA